MVQKYLQSLRNLGYSALKAFIKAKFYQPQNKSQSPVPVEPALC